MLAHRSGADWEVRAPAKLNLLFEVLAKRNDGFHEIETLIVPISVYDHLAFRPTKDSQVLLTCDWAADASAPTGTHEALPAESDNLARRAVLLLRERSGTSGGAVMRLTKRIPIGAGLGGGSSDAAAALVAANAGWRLGWPRERLAPLAAELGSDVPFFLVGGAAVCRGRGEHVTPVERIGRLDFVVVKPPVSLATANVYGRSRPQPRGAPAEELIDALRRGDLAAAGKRLTNRLESAADSLSPWIRRIRGEFQRVDCVGHQMSGSGSSYFGLCRTAGHARWVASRLKSRGVGKVYAVANCN